MLLKDQKPILTLLLFFVFYFLLFEGTMTENKGSGGKMKTEKKQKKQPIMGMKCCRCQGKVRKWNLCKGKEKKCDGWCWEC